MGVPNVSVFDAHARLPLDLQRFGLQDHEYPFHDALLDATIRDFLAYCLVHAPSAALFNMSPPSWKLQGYPGLAAEQSRFAGLQPLANWFFTPRGCGFVHPWFLIRGGFKRAILVADIIGWKPFQDFDLSLADAVILSYSPFWDIKPNIATGQALAVAVGGSRDFPDRFRQLRCVGRRVLLNREMAQRFFGAVNRNFDLRGASCCEPRGSIAVWEVGTPPRDTALWQLPEELLREVGSGQTIVAEWFIDDTLQELRSTPFTRLLDEIFGQGVIPYEHEKRVAAFPEAHDRLEELIRAWEQLPRPGTPAWAALFHNDRNVPC